MMESDKRAKWIIFYVSEREKKLILNEAAKNGKQHSPYCRDIILDYIMKRIVRLENLQQIPQFSNIQDTTLIEGINEVKEMMRQQNIMWEIDRSENLDSMGKLNRSVNESITERILMLLEKPLFLDQIVECLIDIGYNRTPKETLKSLIKLRQNGKVDQSSSMRWFLC